MSIIHWHDAARKLIFPRTVEDAALLERENYLMCTEWETLRNYSRNAHDTLSNSKRQLIADARVGTADIEECLTILRRFRSLDTVPDEISNFELDLLLTIASPERAALYLSLQYGPKAIVTALAYPSVVSSWAEANDCVWMIEDSEKNARGHCMRHILLQQNARTRDECRHAVQDVWDKGDRVLREQLAVAFFEHEPWRDAVLRDVVENAPPFSNVHLALARNAQTIRAILARRASNEKSSTNYVEIVASVGEEALPILLELVEEAKTGDYELHATAMSIFRCTEVAQYFASRISNPKMRYVVGDYFRSHRDLANVALREAGRGSSRNATLAKAMHVELCGLELESTAPDGLVSLNDPAVPAILRQAPWLRPIPALPARFSKGISAYPVRVHVTEEQRRAAEAQYREEYASSGEMTPEEAKVALSSLEDDFHIQDLRLRNFDRTANLGFDANKSFPLESLLKPFCEGRIRNYDIANFMLICFGEKALPGLHYNRDYRPPSKDPNNDWRLPHKCYFLENELMLCMDDAHLAYSLAKSYFQEGKKFWLEWSAKFPRAAIVGLLGSAHDPRRRPCAESMLHKLADDGFTDLILELSDNHKRVIDFLRKEPRQRVWPLEKFDHKPPPVAHRLLLRDGRPLDNTVIDRICDALMLSTLSTPYAGLADIKEACDPRSLAEMAWDLSAGAANRDQHRTGWQHLAIAHFGNDDVVRRLTSLRHPFIYSVLEKLSSRGMQAATMGLVIAVEEAKARGSESNSLTAERALRWAARATNKSRDELVETAVPTLPFKIGGTTEFEFGTRTLHVGFNTALAPVIVHDGKQLASLPRAAQDDDSEALRLAREKWKQLKGDVETLARLRAMALEDAMRTSRRIPFKHFVDNWVHHPLGMHQAYGMVWAVERDGQLITFHVISDGTFADIDDASLQIDANEMIRVPHFAELSQSERLRWGQVLGDYRMMQPVAQLNRVPLEFDRNAAPVGKRTQEFVSSTQKPIQHTIIARILKERAGSSESHSSIGLFRELSRCNGFARYTTESNARLGIPSYNGVDSVTLTFVKKIEHELLMTEENKLAFSEIHPVELSEALYIMRLVSEAE